MGMMIFMLAMPLPVAILLLLIAVLVPSLFVSRTRG